MFSTAEVVYEMFYRKEGKKAISQFWKWRGYKSLGVGR